MKGRSPRFAFPLAAVIAAAAPAGAVIAQAQHDAPDQPLPPAVKAMAIPLGDVLGAPGLRAQLAAKASNPFEGQQSAVEDGKVLYQKMNCAYCHQFKGTGLIGPSLADGQWRYGGRPGEIFQSIYAGRPQGMPAWGDDMPSVKIWQIVSYIESLGGTIPPDVASQGDLPAKPTPAIELDQGVESK